MFEDVDMREASPPLENPRESLESARFANVLAVLLNMNIRGSRVTMISRNLPHRVIVPNNDRLAAARKARSTAKRAKVLGRERLQAVWDDMELTVLPTWLPPAPHHIGDGRHGKLSADF